MIKGFDTVARLTAQQIRKLRDQGYVYALRYLVPDRYAKALTKAEMDAILSEGLMLGLCWETTASRANTGAASGLTDGRTAKELALSMEIPSGTVIYFAVDYYPKQEDYPRIAAYMIAAAESIRPYRLGIYGCYDVIENMHRREIGDKYWQCVGWSNGRWSAHATMQQREWNVKSVVTVDNNYSADLDGFVGGTGLEIKAQRVKLYNNTQWKSPQAIKRETGCKAITNGGLFRLTNGKPLCHLKIDGIRLATDEYAYWGYAIENGKATLTQDESAPDYISCCCMVKNGEPVTMYYNADMSGARQRTAMGTLPDGRAWGYATLSPTTPERLQHIAIEAGVKDAIMLDGGASTWAISDKGELRGGRIAANYVLYFDDCPYTEPAGNIRWGSLGQGAKWVQWHLNLHGCGLAVDGIFGSKSVSALKDYQRHNGLDADGICGKLTRAKMKG